MRALLTLLLCLATPSLAQDRQGNDTPGEWIVDHQSAFGLWDSFCDYRITGDLREERCYLRYVDGFSKRPRFGAQFFFLTPGPAIEFGIEPGTLFDAGGFRILQGDAAIWIPPVAGCLIGLACTFSGDEAEALLQAMTQGDDFAFDFIDRHGTRQSLRWDLMPFAAALAEFRSEAAKRGI